MTVKEYLKAIKKLAKKRGLLDLEVLPFGEETWMFIKVLDEDGKSKTWWKVGYERNTDEGITPFIRP